MKPFLDFFRKLTLLPQGATIVAVGFLPIFAIVSMFPAVPSIIAHFADDPDARWKVPLMVSTPGLAIAVIAPFAGYFVDRVGRRPLLMWATFFYGIFGTAPFFLDDLNMMFASRLMLGVAEAVILTVVNTLIGDYWEDEGRRAWLFVQGLIGPFLAAGVILAVGSATTLQWNAGFLVYLIAFPIFFAMRAYLFEPVRGGATIAEIATRRDAVGPFPVMNVAMIGLTTLLTSAIYYVFIINGGLAFKEVGVDSPARLSQLTAMPSLFVMAGAVIFWLVRGRSNGLQIAIVFALIGGGLAGIGLADDVRAMTIALAFQQAGAGMAVPVLIAWAQIKLPFEHRGRGMGIWSSCFFLGQFSSPWLVHQIDGAVGTMQGAFLVMGLAGLGFAVIALLPISRHCTASAPTPGDNLA